jgi:hypothetical protein
LEGCHDEGVYFLAAIVALGAIPLLVQLLGPGSPAGVHERAAGILRFLAGSTDANQVAIAAAGAIPLLVQLMRPASSVMVQVGATNVVMFLVPSLYWCSFWILQFLDGPPAKMQGMAAQTLGWLAVNAEDAATIAAAGAIPLLVQLLKPGSPADVQSAISALADLLPTRRTQSQLLPPAPSLHWRS